MYDLYVLLYMDACASCAYVSVYCVDLWYVCMCVFYVCIVCMFGAYLGYVRM